MKKNKEFFSIIQLEKIHVSIDIQYRIVGGRVDCRVDNCIFIKLGTGPRPEMEILNMKQPFVLLFLSFAKLILWL